MRARGPFEVKPRQLRALVLLLALLPVVPTTFVVRFLVDDLSSQRLESREHARPIYQQSLERLTTTLAADVARAVQIPAADPAAPGTDDPWKLLESPPATAAGKPFADTLLLIDGAGHLSPLSAPLSPKLHASEALASTVLETGARFAALPRTGLARWRYFSELPEPLFALRPAPTPGAPPGGKSLLLLLTRQHLRERIEAFYQRESNFQVAVRVLDENGEGTPVRGAPDDPAAATPVPASSVGDPLAEVALPAPLPAWRAQLFVLDPALVDGIARSQVAFYWWTVGGMFVVTAGIAVTAGWTLTRRIALHELSNDTLAVVSHEMKTPLASTRLFIETLLEHRYHDGSSQLEEYLQLIADENHRLERLVDSFQTLSKLENRRRGAPLTLEPIHAGEVARAAADRLRARLEAPGCAFTLTGGDEPVSLRADREGLVTVLVNLIDNALKYTGDDKRITLRCGARGSEIVYEVSDNGAGIASDEQRRIFERFYQSDRRLSRAHEGIGLGLSIVRSMVRAHRGTVSVQSNPEQGSVFTVRLPALGK